MEGCLCVSVNSGSRHSLLFQRCEASLSKKTVIITRIKGRRRRFARRRIENMKRDAETKKSGGGELQCPSV